MAKAFGIYQHLPPSVKKSIRKINQLIGKGGGNSSGNPQRNHHYIFDVDDNGLNINGFILHTDKHKGKRQKFRVYLDSNKNGRFDKQDQLIGRTGLHQLHAAKGVGNVLDEDELGQLEVKFKRDDGMLQIVQRNSESNALMRVDQENYPTIRDTPLNSFYIESNENQIQIKAISLKHPDINLPPINIAPLPRPDPFLPDSIIYEPDTTIH